MSLPQHDIPQSRAEPVAEVLARVQAELEEIARRIDRNQATIARSTWQTGAGDGAYLEAMQDADLSAQRIAGVADFLRAIADAAHPRWRIDTAAATDTLKLAGLIRAIGTASPGSKVRDKDETEDGAKAEDGAGNVDLF